MWANRWIIEWRERGRGDEAVETATTAEEALEICRRFLENETAFDESQDADRPAFDVLFDDAEPLVILSEMDDRLEVKCENGEFIVRRTFEHQQGSPPRSLSKAAPALLDFAQLFLAYHDAETPEHVTIQTLEHAARTAVAMAEGSPPTPLTPETIVKLKEHYLDWTGGFPPDDEDEIFTYTELAMESGPDPEEVRLVLRRWMEESADEKVVADPYVVLGDQRGRCQ
jgi:hypothetical protein